MNIERLPNESYLAYAQRLTDAVSDGLLNWQEWADNLLGAGVYTGEACVRSGRFFRKFLEKCASEPQNSVEKVDNSLNGIKLERQKLQDANRELKQTYREQARHELFSERLIDAISRLEPLTFEDRVCCPHTSEDSTGVLCIADAHLGVEVNLRDAQGRPVNVYDANVLRDRLQSLIESVDYDYALFAYDRLVVIDLGDGINGLLRWSDTTKVKQGVVDATLQYAEIVSQFLNELSNRLGVPIEYHILGSNHAQLRLLESKPNFPEEDMGKIIRELVTLRLSANPHIEVKPYSDCDLIPVRNMTLLAYHGHGSKNDFDEINFWQNYHNVKIDALIVGHLHHGAQQSVGYAENGEQEVIHVPSLIGIEPFAVKYRKMSRAGAKFFVVDDNGKTFERTYVLN